MMTRRDFFRGVAASFAAACLASAMRWLPSAPREVPATGASLYRIGQEVYLRDLDGRLVFIGAGRAPPAGHRLFGVVVSVSDGAVQVSMTGRIGDQMNQVCEPITGRRVDTLIIGTAGVQDGLYRVPCIQVNAEPPPCA